MPTPLDSLRPSTPFTAGPCAAPEPPHEPPGPDAMFGSFGPPGPFDLQAPVEGLTTLFAKGVGDAGAIDVNDVRQGDMGNCYFVGALAALAKENPHAIQDMVHESRNAVGQVVSYTVDLYRRAPPLDQLTKIPVTVDARAFSQVAAGAGDVDGAGRDEIWVKVLEKAYARLNGGYEKIGHGGYPDHALEALTGLPSRHCAPAAYHFDQLRRDLAEGRPVCFSTAADIGRNGTLNFRASHCYAVVDCEIRDGRRMVRLANPWGKEDPGLERNGWIAYDGLMKGEDLAGVDVGPPKVDLTLRDAVDSMRSFWRG